MAVVTDFEAELFRKSPARYARWHAIDLHNHTPVSFDYEAGGGDVVGRCAKSIVDRNLAAVMFTDHVFLPDANFVNELRRRTGRLILRGVEMNVFVDAWTKPKSKIEKNLFFHLLIGFDPEASETAEYWLTHIYKRCRTEERESGGIKIKGVTDSIERICDELKGANALVIPAHLHSDRDAFKSRSFDDLYADPEFLKTAANCFTCLEVTDPFTAEYFDGKHSETNNLHKACIRSSDSHSPDQLGVRPCFAQMENVTFAELKHALELPFRVKLKAPELPSSHVVGLNIRGQFFPDLWLSLSPNCNVFMGVKGSGKTSVLECLRFVLGVEVPKSRNDDENGHLNAILGPGGTVRALVKRSDGAKIIIQRTMGADQYVVTFEDDRQQVFGFPDAIQFPASILGWHEIEQAATDSRIRKVYLDAISGREAIRQFDTELKSYSQQIHASHDNASSRLRAFRDSQAQVLRLRERREGLQQLKDASLVKLKEEYEAAIRHRDLVNTTHSQLVFLKSQLTVRLAQVLAGVNAQEFAVESPLKACIQNAGDAVQALVASTDETQQKLNKCIDEALAALHESKQPVLTEFDKFAQHYRTEFGKLTPEQQNLLESHRRVMEETKQLPALESQLASLKSETEQLVKELIRLCEAAATKLEARSSLREQRVSEFSRQLEEFGVKLELAQYSYTPYSSFQSSYPEGWKAYSDLASGGNEKLLYRRMKRRYELLLSDLANDYPVFLQSPQFSYFIDSFEDDDLRITFKPNGPSGAEKPIDQLSAGQRCTAFFPVLLKLREGPLVVDQPEDNLDNRHIASSIAPVLLEDKIDRQIILTSHNANLVVLSDAEHVVTFEGKGDQGVVLERGFLAGQESKITSHIVDILDGGERALALRRLKYGLTDSVS